MKISAIIVDDEPLALERLRSLLEQESDITIIEECSGGAEALAAMRRRRPDLLLLDIHMPEMDGFEVLSRLGPPLPLVIFVTAFDHHAVKAFEAQALDYILKPFKPARFRSALERARQHLALKQADEIGRRVMAMLNERDARSDAYLARIAVRDRQRVRFVRTADIDWIEASGNYVVLHAGKERHVLRQTLTSFEQQLSPREFVRINRSAIVRLDRVQHIEPTFNNEHVVVLTDGTRVAMTRSLRDLQDRMRFD